MLEDGEQAELEVADGEADQAVHVRVGHVQPLRLDVQDPAIRDFAAEPIPEELPQQRILGRLYEDLVRSFVPQANDDLPVELRLVERGYPWIALAEDPPR